MLNYMSRGVHRLRRLITLPIVAVVATILLIVVSSAFVATQARADTGTASGPTQSSPGSIPLGHPAPFATDVQSASENAVDHALETQAGASYGGLQTGPGGQGLVVHVVVPPDASGAEPAVNTPVAASDVPTLIQQTVSSALSGLPSSEAMSAGEIHYVTATATIDSLTERTAQLDNVDTTLQSQGLGLNGWTRYSQQCSSGDAGQPGPEQ